jgi:anthranilate synthase component 1
VHEEEQNSMKQTTFDEFVELARRGTFVPVVKEIMADLLTPVSAFLKIAEHSDYAFLFESVEGGEQVARYSFLGKDPFLVLRSRDGKTVIDRSGVTTETTEPFVPAVRRLMAEFRAPFVQGLPRFTGGAVGFIGYDASIRFEPVLGESWKNAAWTKTEDGKRKTENEQEDEAGFMLFDTVLAFDHVKHRILIIANARVTADEDLSALYQFACAKIQFLERELERGLSQPARASRKAPKVSSNLTREMYEAGVRTIKERIAAGDIYQAVLSQRFEAKVEAEPLTVYRALRHVNPSPYMYFIRMGKLAIVGSSPEMLVRVEGQHVETHPIAGTRPRGRNEEEDLRLADELKRNEKERAEHVMLVDLGRNDLGRVCEYGSVKVPQYMGLERFSHVMHLVSTVEGRLADTHDHLDALVSCFPAGTVSGAPKIRAMRILAALEPTRRDLYAGAVGYIDFAGNLDFCIAIRTITLRDGVARVQAGGGIVADSNPAAEYQESCDKAGALLQAIEMAETEL